jgi:biotin operon repressor
MSGRKFFTFLLQRRNPLNGGKIEFSKFEMLVKAVNELNQKHQKISIIESKLELVSKNLLEYEKRLKKHEDVLKKILELLEKVEKYNKKLRELKKPEIKQVEVVKHEVNMPHYVEKLLSILRTAKNPLSAEEIAKMLKKSKKTVYNYLYRLKEFGYEYNTIEKNGRKLFYLNK